MKTVSLAGALVYATLFYLWSYRIASFYFEITWGDLVSLVLALTLPMLLGYNWQKPKLKALRAFSLLFLVGAPFLVQPMVTELVSWTNAAWLFVHFFMAIFGATLGVMMQNGFIVSAYVSLVLAWLYPSELKENQKRYFDRVVASIETRKGSCQLVEWKNDLWVHYNKQLLYSTLDAHMLKEAAVQPVIHLADGSSKEVLIIGGDSGLLVNELSKFDSLSITLVPYDPELRSFLKKRESLNLQSPGFILSESRERIFKLLSDSTKGYDIILIDLPSPANLEFQPFFTEQFYRLCRQRLHQGGFLSTRSYNPHLRSGKVEDLKGALTAAGFSVLTYQTHIPTMGQSLWLIGSMSRTEESMREQLLSITPGVDTQWWNTESMQMMLSFGKRGYFESLGNN